ncbi:HIT domain-containing protein [bacterium]|nr:HIT domain-containing protein [bacterium]
MEILWAPWRMEYLRGTAVEDEKKDCIFCTMLKENRDRENLILYRGSSAFVVMNLYPYNSGHLMVVPNRHIGQLSDLQPEEMLELGKLLQQTVHILERTMHPQGFNIGMNLGRIAGAGIADHIHYHLVPRWGGDTNFMPVVGQTKVLSESLQAGWEKLSEAFRELSPGA